MPEKPRTGVILAAGFGSRLRGVSSETSLKPLTPVAGRPLLLRTLDSLAVAGCRRAVVVLGHGAEDVRDAVRAAYDGPLELSFAFNPHYELKNGVSVLAARPFVEGTFLLTMADHVFGDEVMALSGGHTPAPGGATLLVDYKLDAIFDMDDATKVLEREGRVVDIGKAIPEYNCIDTGAFVCTEGLLDALEAVYAAQGDASLSDGVARLAAEGRMYVLDIGDGFWQDVDTPAMLRHAETILEQRERIGVDG
ncbi:NTP transferase domain-containing protein [Rhodocaloribacter litoris]|uniref:phosphocholine cytidylyltransferase family protein n=1 Tax=Rhodocaloribacter litoris TaxID=2558931 RepID=UPI001424722A|nr:NTP transferase domain-containing protein [Rhodocaloribacter litoris]QXD14920.1 NTP transferase domain-containing protein [Rhodocaloribacter litoris]